MAVLGDKQSVQNYVDHDAIVEQYKRNDAVLSHSHSRTCNPIGRIIITIVKIIRIINVA